jgi:hypothetical protein
MIKEYTQRKRLAGLGLFSDLNRLPAYKVDVLIYIDSEFERLANEKAKKAGKKNHGR